jgi:beta-glucosidase
MSHDILSSPFTWATGIEDTFIPQSRPGFRALEEYELTQHYNLWKSDFDLVAKTGVQAVRWGIPWYRVQPAPDRWDWEWTDQALDYLVNVKGITPILDLMHYGTPLWLEESFVDPGYPQRVAEYTAAVVAHYQSLIRYYTPLNEPMVNADMCGMKGEWPPYLSGDDGYVKMILALAKGIILTTQAIKAEQPDAITIQVEALWHTFTQDASLEPRVAQDNARQYLCFDLTTGRVSQEYDHIDYLQKHGITDEDLNWFHRNAVTFDIFGANFYPWSYGEQKQQADGSVEHITGETTGDKIAIVIQEVYKRYHMPVMITETSANADVKGRAKWMYETLDAVRALRATGVPVIGYTWFPLFTMVDWAYRTGDRPLDEYLIHLGLFDSEFDANGTLNRCQTPLVETYREQMRHPMPSISPH